MTITIVAGFGRCGSSLIMQMLEAGGMPCAGEYPAFEDEHTGGEFFEGAELDRAWLSQMSGHAIKILDPHRGRIPVGDYHLVWCSRDQREQAKSQAKFAHLLMGVPISRTTVRQFERSYRADKIPAIRALLDAAPGKPILDLRFEEVLRDPLHAANELAAHCGLRGTVREMSSVVRRRSPLCAPGMDMEMSLISERP